MLILIAKHLRHPYDEILKYTYLKLSNLLHVSQNNILHYLWLCYNDVKLYKLYSNNNAYIFIEPWIAIWWLLSSIFQIYHIFKINSSLNRIELIKDTFFFLNFLLVF